ncbi:Fic family protein [uncultured Varibaculum sp.]|uniref:Fic family protein n=1 Tax=uncultured Varibaculum sp. TaxID=413896 RepID=UPI002588CF6F|nr:Fic family protein [uncultured Varibaculum sp.]
MSIYERGSNQYAKRLKPRKESGLVLPGLFTASVDEILDISVPKPSLAPKVRSKQGAMYRFEQVHHLVVLDMAVNEGLPVTLPQVQTLLDDITPEGMKIEEAAEVKAIDKANQQMLFALKNSQPFDLGLAKKINYQLTAEVIDRGLVRGTGVTHGGGHVSLAMGAKYSAPDGDENDLEGAYEKIVERAKEYPNPLEGAAYTFCALTLLQAFGDGNKRTSRLMASGLLLGEGIDAIYIPASVRGKYQEGLNRLFRNMDTSVIAGLLYDSVCSGDYLGDA